MFKKEKEFEDCLNKSDKEMRHAVKKENLKTMVLTATHAATLVVAHTLAGAIVGDSIGFIVANSIEDAFPKTFGFGSSNYEKAFGLTKAGCTVTGTAVGLSLGFGEMKCANHLCKENLNTYDQVFIRNAMKGYENIDEYVDVEISEEGNEK
jgi:hypothetical protein